MKESNQSQMCVTYDGWAEMLPQCYDTWCVFEMFFIGIKAGSIRLHHYFLIFSFLRLRNFLLQAVISLVSSVPNRPVSYRYYGLILTSQS